mmetsp:Transcript_25564/g.31017  ORF Transcript_25564/g.31017 Transcript_25564/m.31017 type:complete len:556 (-) Transcript_25564:83-1750(-)
MPVSHVYSEERTATSYFLCSIVADYHFVNLLPCWVINWSDNTLGFHVVAEGIFTLVTANTGHLETTERCGVVVDVVGVHPDGTGLQGARQTVAGVVAVTPDASCETVLGAVGPLDQVSLVAPLEDGHNRSEDLLLCNSHVVIDVSEHGGLDEVTLGTDGAASALQVRALLNTGLNVHLDLPELLVGHLRTLVNIPEGIPDSARLGERNSLLNELVIDILVYEQPRPGVTALAHIEEETEVGIGNSFVDVCVLAHDGSRLASQLQAHALEVGLCSSFHNVLTDLSGAGEGNLVNIPVFRNSLSCSFTVSCDDVDDTFGDTGLLDELSQLESGEWSLLGELEHNSVTGREGWGKLPRCHKQREVPGDNLAAYTDGLMESVREVVSGSGDGLAVNLVGPAGKIPEVTDGQRHIGVAGEEDRLAVVHGFKLSKLFRITLQQICKLVEELATFTASHLWPRTLVEGGTGSCHCELDIGRIALLDVADGGTGAWIFDGEGSAPHSVHELVVDKKLCLFNEGCWGVRHCGHGDAGNSCRANVENRPWLHSQGHRLCKLGKHR